MAYRQWVASLALAAMLAGCGGGGGGSPTFGGGSTGSAPSPTPAPAATACSLIDRQNWVLGQMREWYLFPETLPVSPNPAAYTTLDDFVDALTATARSQRKDRYFTYVTSIREENAFYNSGSSAGFGVRLSYDTAAGRVFVSEAFEGAPALTAGIDRGTEILAIGTSASNLRTVSSILAASGTAGVTDALGPSTAGTTRVLRVTDAGGQRDLTVSKADYALVPVSTRYGAKIIEEEGRRYGYVNLRTFISTANDGLRSAFAQFKAAGVSDVVVDLRYNGGGLVSVAETFSNLLGGGRQRSDVMSYQTFRPEKSSENETTFFAPEANSIAPTRIAFIGTGGTASASEFVINAFVPYLHSNAALVGANTFGKPVGQIALDRSACDDRLRVIAFAIQNAARQGAYYDGLANTVEASCQASDDVAYPLGDPREASTRAALNFLQGKACTPIARSAQSAQSAQARSASSRRELLAPERPSTAQREVPGLF